MRSTAMLRLKHHSPVGQEHDRTIPSADYDFTAAVPRVGRKFHNPICAFEARWPTLSLYLNLFEGAPERSNSLGNRKSATAWALCERWKPIVLQSRALWMGAQHVDAVDKDNAALIGN
jgi:hypothetical protein